MKFSCIIIRLIVGWVSKGYIRGRGARDISCSIGVVVITSA